ncbi:glycosyltransferase family A protein [Enterococcus ratti]|uniref:Glycosyl transferase n=1 Tax=Enterococcus ratti TaxID=150033 RepID=A0A1L8W8S9_9ENTE|nr:glycosyltransferase family 2 protein [Enterococcus ratti]OJG77092.1 glycosyl transferase [Enterococcus ratti]
MDNPKFSIVIPIYNAENVIYQTIETLKELDFDDYEVVLINDGSTDQTETILTELIQNESKFRLITTDNQGPGLARNEGIKYSRGNYLLFFDVDDTPAKDVLSVYNQLVSVHPELDLIVSSFLFRTIDGGKVVSEKENLVSERHYTDHQSFIKDMYQLMNNQLMYVVWNKCYRSDILKQNHILFKGYSSCEDRIFNLNYYKYCHQVMTNPKIAYTYEFEGGKGITNQYHPHKFDTFKEFYQLANELTDGINKPGMAALHLKGTTSVIFSIYSTSLRNAKEKKVEARQILMDPTIHEAKKIACTDSTAKKVTKQLYNLPISFFLTAMKMGSFVENKLPGLMAVLKRVY